jgi:hypothetical protein
MKKSRKVWLGIATIWPIVYMFLFIGAIFLLVLFSGLQDGGPGAGSHPPSLLFPFGFMGLMVVHMVTILGTLALTVFYIIRVFKTERLDQNMKIMWMLLLFFMGMIVQPIFWYLYIWRDKSELSTEGTPRPALGAASASSWTGQTTAPREAAYVPPTQPPDWR